MADRRRKYLEQLVELGEREVVLGRRTEGPTDRRTGSRADKGTAEPVPLTQAVRPSVGPSVNVPSVRPSVGPSVHVPSVRPPVGPSVRLSMYPPGLVIAEPAARSDLFTSDPIGSAPSLDALAQIIAGCVKCGLHASRTMTVPGEGNPNADFVCVGEAPGQTEDETGRPFVGRAGQLLTDILRAIGLARESVFICNVLKCRPPGNRNPEPMEAAACSPYLHRQLQLLKPRVILALGRPAAMTLLGTNTSLAEARQKVHRYRGVPLVVTYHPAALLRNPNWKPATWDDVRIARRILDGEAC